MRVALVMSARAAGSIDDGEEGSHLYSAMEFQYSLIASPHTMPITPQYEVTCVDKRVVAKDTIELVTTKPDGFTFTPGQFVLFHVPLVGVPEDMQPRAYSIASSPNDTDLLFLIKIVEQGRAGRWLTTEVDIGTNFVFKGPFGNFTTDLTEDKKYIFIATGAGMAPYRAMWRSVEPENLPNLHVIFGVRDETYLFWMEELAELAKRAPGLRVDVVLSQGSSAWTGRKGHVQDIVRKRLQSGASDTALFACGNPAMTKDVKTMAVETFGMDKKCVHIEGYV
jgi:ferredoxin-NADP reductase